MSLFTLAIECSYSLSIFGGSMTQLQLLVKILTSPMRRSSAIMDNGTHTNTGDPSLRINQSRKLRFNFDLDP